MYDLAMVAPASPLSMTDGQREVLETVLRSHTAPVRQVRRAQVLLLAAEGVSNVEIAERCDVSRPTVLAWRKQFQAQGLTRFGEVAEGRGAKSTIPEQTIAEIVRLTTQTVPEGATHWSVRAMAKRVGISPASVQRIWSQLGLKPHRVDTFKVSTDPRFAEKLIDVVGLYLNPRAPRGADDSSGGERPSPPASSQRGG
jgi:transposase